MKELNISTFIQIMQTGLMDHDGQESAGCFLLDAINDQDYVSEHGYWVNLDSKKISRLVSRKDPVPDGIRLASQKEEVIRDALIYFEKEVIPDLNPHVKDDVLEKLANVIRQDKEISGKKREYLIELYDQNAIGRFLGEVFLYVVNRDNKLREVGDTVDCNDMPLLAEVNYECPLCHKKLIETVKGEPVKRYIITQIFPENLSEEKKEEFSKIYNPPMNLNSMENLIALNEQCSDDYLLKPTADEYKKLYELKRGFSLRYQAKVAIDNATLEEDIRTVISFLMNVDAATELVPLEYDALRIDEKIDDYILKTETQFRVVQYYRYVESLFSQSESDFDLIASEIKIASRKLESKGLSQPDVVRSLSEWIRNKAHMGEDGSLACDIVVAFFVQNCEVFHK